ncbi:hypothetical protein GIB67_039986 [Kingdonia uniflora]|uniref:Subtilisin-like protease n=1 Tax=Kingdonia uniflora TaxID=39325 RepID=A0A7J7LIA0_9MAGN|nr:hypothetical protein GIB67_039986 [Kingdonia uniflora]
MKVSGLLLLFHFVFLSLLHTPTFALKKSYVVYLGGHSYDLDVSAVDLERVTQSHYDFLGSFLGSSDKAKDAIFYSYNKHINGFAAMLEEDEVEAISKHPRVVSVFLNKARKMHTTRSWNFLGLEKNGEIPTGSLWKKARFGEDAIIANLDTEIQYRLSLLASISCLELFSPLCNEYGVGVWPESPSFQDDGMGPIPSKWKGICQNNTKEGVPCNRKLIGASFFYKGYLAVRGGPISYSARDEDGHGTHTLSTAGASFVKKASLFGFGKGTAKGGSPKSRVVAYRVLWNDEAFDADILAAFDAAIHDGVDVVSVSLGVEYPQVYATDGVSIGAFHAVQKGLSVVCSAGNSGPLDGTISNVSPWMLTVGASTMDREFPTHVVLGNNQHFKGQSISETRLQAGRMYTVIGGADATAQNALAQDALLCKPNSLDPKKVKGKILVCLRGENGRNEKGANAAKAGAVGMILANDAASGNEIIADPHVLPAIHLSYLDGLQVYAYLNASKSPVAYFTPPQTKLNTKPAPFMASFTSKGPNTLTPEILKPDITAPGVSILASWTEATSPTGLKSDKRRVLFNSISGTSMSCPHVAGIVGLLRTLYPDWTPSAIKSAIMTSAGVKDNNLEAVLNSSYTQATPFSYGAGHMWPNRAADPGLVYDLTPKDYLNFLCGIGYTEEQIQTFSKEPYKCPKKWSLLDFNYPSISVPKLSGRVHLTRTVKNVGGGPSKYHVLIHEPHGVSVSVKPKTLVFKKNGEEKKFKVTVKARHVGAASEYVFGSLTWSDEVHHVRSPIVVKAKGK